ncbi:hypothetical protein [Aliiruegeria lutimaris]|uniref:hypothetical protein n=1 Tax=Aliiruegeria lutimaris TaxID=571298 RepID=UPI001BAFC2DC|nr:hypothetical protein [Aliiruegeria lutimaris]
MADPERAPQGMPFTYAHPDETADTGSSWRDELLKYNDAPGNNPLGLLPAWQLYQNETYSLLANRYGLGSLYILSAGWGLIAADFLTPKYDITFSAQADAYKRRRKKDQYHDLNMLPVETDEPVVFFVSKEYIPLACSLTKDLRTDRHIFFSSKVAPNAPGCILRKYETRTRTNWQYECAKAFMGGKVGI